MAITERLCCGCLDVATGSVLAGIYTCFVSLIFLALSIENIVDANKDVHHPNDIIILKAIYGLLLAFSVLFGIVSVSVVLGAARKLKTYVVWWIVLTPVWTIIMFCALVVMPISITNPPSTHGPAAVAGAIVLLVLNTYCMICVCVFFATLLKSSAHNLKSLAVFDALESGFSNGYSRLRESIRPSKSKGAVNFSNISASAHRATAASGSSVVLNPRNLEVPRTSPPRKASAEPDTADVGENWRQSLSACDQLGHADEQAGVVNPGFLSTD